MKESAMEWIESKALRAKIVRLFENVIANLDLVMHSLALEFATTGTFKTQRSRIRVSLVDYREVVLQYRKACAKANDSFKDSEEGKQWLRNAEKRFDKISGDIDTDELRRRCHMEYRTAFRLVIVDDEMGKDDHQWEKRDHKDNDDYTDNVDHTNKLCLDIVDDRKENNGQQESKRLDGDTTEGGSDKKKQGWPARPMRPLLLDCEEGTDPFAVVNGMLATESLVSSLSL